MMPHKLALRCLLMKYALPPTIISIIAGLFFVAYGHFVVSSHDIHELLTIRSDFIKLQQEGGKLLKPGKHIFSWQTEMTGIPYRQDASGRAIYTLYDDGFAWYSELAIDTKTGRILWFSAGPYIE